MSGIEVDEDGGVTFDPAKFAAGFVGGAVAGKAASKLASKTANSNLKPLSAGEIWQNLIKWHNAPQKSKNKLLVSPISESEAEKLSKEFNFRGKYPLAREIRSDNVAHAMKEHGNPATEEARGQIAINLRDISRYQEYIDGADLRIAQDNGRIIYGKQINGYYAVIEGVLEKQNKLIFFDMWKVNGKMNKQTLTQRRTSEAD